MMKLILSNYMMMPTTIAATVGMSNALRGVCGLQVQVRKVKVQQNFWCCGPPQAAPPSRRSTPPAVAQPRPCLTDKELFCPRPIYLPDPASPTAASNASRASPKASRSTPDLTGCYQPPENDFVPNWASESMQARASGLAGAGPQAADRFNGSEAAMYEDMYEDEIRREIFVKTGRQYHQVYDKDNKPWIAEWVRPVRDTDGPAMVWSIIVVGPNKSESMEEVKASMPKGCPRHFKVPVRAIEPEVAIPNDPLFHEENTTFTKEGNRELRARWADRTHLPPNSLGETFLAARAMAQLDEELFGTRPETSSPEEENAIAELEKELERNRPKTPSPQADDHAPAPVQKFPDGSLVRIHSRKEKGSIFSWNLKNANGAYEVLSEEDSDGDVFRYRVNEDDIELVAATQRRGP